MKRLLVVVFGILVFQGTVWADSCRKAYPIGSDGGARILYPDSENLEIKKKAPFLLQWKVVEVSQAVNIRLHKKGAEDKDLFRRRLNNRPNTGTALITKQDFKRARVKAGEEYFFKVELNPTRPEQVISSECFTFNVKSKESLVCESGPGTKTCLKALIETIAGLQAQLHELEVDPSGGGVGNVMQMNRVSEHSHSYAERGHSHDYSDFQGHGDSIITRIDSPEEPAASDDIPRELSQRDHGVMVRRIGSLEKPVASDDIPQQLAQHIQRAAEVHPDNQMVLQQSRTVFVGTERVRRKMANGEEDPRMLVWVIHYRYDDDAAIHTLVNADEMAVIDRREGSHLPAKLGPSELEEAARLALADPRVQALLGDHVSRVKVEGLLSRTTDREDPFFGRRVVYMLFRVGRDYLGGAPIFVDLTNRTVFVEGPR